MFLAPVAAFSPLAAWYGALPLARSISMDLLFKNTAYLLQHVDPESGFGIIYSAQARHCLYLNPLATLLWQHTPGAIDASLAAPLMSAEAGIEVSPDVAASLISDLRRKHLLLTGPEVEALSEPSPAPPRVNGHPLAHLYFYSTRECNARCYHCYQPTVRVRSVSRPLQGGQISGNEFLRVVRDARPLGLTSVKITGGEPFLREDMGDIIGGIGALGLQIAVETNGTLIDERMADILTANMAKVAVSLDGGCAATHDAYRCLPGGFDRAVGALRLLRARGCDAKIIMSVSQRNYHELEDVIRVAKDTGCTFVKINPVSTLGLANQLKNESVLLTIEQIMGLFRQRRELEEKHNIAIFLEGPPAFSSVSDIVAGRLGVCPFTNILGVLADGSLSYCGIGNTRDELVFGYVREPGFDIGRLWRENPQLLHARELLAGGIGGVCSRCVHESFCKGACRALAYDEFESFVAPHAWCQKAYDEGLFPEHYLIPE
jgi:AdoMet-dependent heme synthase